MSDNDFYDRTINQIRYATYPASLGTVSLILYHFIIEIEPKLAARPGSFFLFASVCFFFDSILVALGIPPWQPVEREEADAEKQLKNRQARVISAVFMIGVIFEILGLVELIYGVINM